MHLVLTHEQADFDALGSLYAAALLSGALPVLPRRMNRNVRAFITLYGVEFPFVDPRDLPAGPIDTVTLVDTQSLITLKGMGKKTKIRVFDHHPRRSRPKISKGKEIPAEWDVVTFELGATTTYFVEIIQERGEVLTALQATLLLLGIYEDTGTLTFSRTTARDMYAAAWLMEQGAELRSITDFLNPPLSLDQREVYDRLVANIETHDINGHQIMLACDEAATASEEFSTLAHKLRDLFDPDALFVLIHTAEGVRFIARSSTDQIDVSAIMAHFGGGGHNRAAAALVKPQTAEISPLKKVKDELLEVLPHFVRPAVTVAQLMSKRPRVISADMPVDDAAKLMARYGYEGFPVVNDGKVIGLLTRRSVDRAISHRLNTTASSLMEAGAISVHPADSLQRLQGIMIDSGWGQIPVVDPETSKVVGIVTRTDVLKMLSRRHPHTAQFHSMTDKLNNVLAPDVLEIIHVVANQAASEHLPVFVVGGFVRDLLLDHPSVDLDLVVEGDAILLGKGLVSNFGGKLTCHTRFGTAKWYLEASQFAGPRMPVFIDLISARQEFYEHPSALPIVEHGSIKLDLHRRDFTINTLALRLDGRHFGELHDYYGGLKDLNQHFVRVLHSLSFIDDPTRMLRAVRYEQRYGFEIETRTLQLIVEAHPLLTHLSPERVRHELDLIFDEPKAAIMLSRLDELGLIKSIAEYLPWNKNIFERLNSAAGRSIPPDWGFLPSEMDQTLNEALFYCLWLMDLAPGDIDRLQQRMSFPMVTFKSIQTAARLRADLPDMQGGKPSQWVDRLDGVPLLAIYAVYLASGEKAFESYAKEWRKIHPKSTGDTLKARGLTPGPMFQNILRVLRNAWLDGELISDNAENNLLNELISDQLESQ